MAPSSYHVISNKIENYLFKHSIIFRHTCKPHWQSCEIMIFFCKYDVFISDILAGSFLLVAISELHEKPRKKDWVTEKST